MTTNDKSAPERIRIDPDYNGHNGQAVGWPDGSDRHAIECANIQSMGADIQLVRERGKRKCPN